MVEETSATAQAAEPSPDAGREPSWCARLATQLAERGGLEAELLSPRLQVDVLGLARDIAHRTERKNAPVAAFVLGRYVEARVGQGISAEAAAIEAAETVAALLPDEPGATP